MYVFPCASTPRPAKESTPDPSTSVIQRKAGRFCEKAICDNARGISTNAVNVGRNTTFLLDNPHSHDGTDRRSAGARTDAAISVYRRGMERVQWKSAASTRSPDVFIFRDSRGHGCVGASAGGT